MSTIRVLVDYLVKYLLTLYFVGPPTDILLTISNLATKSQFIFLTRTLTPNLPVY